MRITNRHGLPETFLRAALKDDYDKGDADISVTQLISPPRIILLQDLNDSKIEIDVVDRLPSMLGTAVHKILEKGVEGVEGLVLEERMFLSIGDVKISGAVDLQIDNGDGTWDINDYKVTSVYSVMNEKPEWEQQLNCYAFLARMTHNREIRNLKIVALLRDWSRRAAMSKFDYPTSRVEVVDIPLWDFKKQEDFVRERVRVHREARLLVDNGKSPPYCTDSERWVRGEKWALMKEGRKAAIKLYDSQDEARKAADGEGLSVEYRPGTATRCEGNYCLVRDYCRQWKESQL